MAEDAAKEPSHDLLKNLYIEQRLTIKQVISVLQSDYHVAIRCVVYLIAVIVLLFNPLL